MSAGVGEILTVPCRMQAGMKLFAQQRSEFDIRKLSRESQNEIVAHSADSTLAPHFDLEGLTCCRFPH